MSTHHGHTQTYARKQSEGDGPRQSSENSTHRYLGEIALAVAVQLPIIGHQQVELEIPCGAAQQRGGEGKRVRAECRSQWKVQR